MIIDILCMNIRYLSITPNVGSHMNDFRSTDSEGVLVSFGMYRCE